MTGRRARATGSTPAEGVGARLRVLVFVCGRDHRVQSNLHDALSQHCLSQPPDDQALKTMRGQRAKEKQEAASPLAPPEGTGAACTLIRAPQDLSGPTSRIRDVGHLSQQQEEPHEPQVCPAEALAHVLLASVTSLVPEKPE